jgi:RNA polymerase sigma-70 factor (ECF subfamily)
MGITSSAAAEPALDWGRVALEDEEVVARVLAGEVGLFEVLMRRHNQRLYRVIRTIVRDETEAEDVMQETYVRAFAALSQFEGRARWATWVTRIAVNEALARVRRRGRFVRGDVESIADGALDGVGAGAGDFMEDGSMTQQHVQGDAGSGGPEAATAARELSAHVEHAIDELSEAYRTVFVLREVEELSTAETAACLEISEELVKVRLHRARAELRHILDARLGAATREVFNFHASRCNRVVAAVFSRLGAR